MKVFKYIYYIVISCIVLIALLLIVSIFPISGNFRVLSVLSGSMEPAIHTGSVVVISPASSYKVGDVVTFGKISKNSTPTTHRITAINGGKITTKGDANNVADSNTILPSDIAGKVRLAIPYAGYLVNSARKPVGFAILILIPAVIIIYEELKSVWREAANLRKHRQEQAEQEKILDMPKNLLPASMVKREEKK
jgi:signal peptidase